jgi:hypothetical protein
MNTVYTTSKGKLLNKMERFYIYKETKTVNQINDKCKVKPNILFDTIVNEDTDRAL